MSDIDPRNMLLQSSYYSQGQVMALGRIAELSALLEALMRQVLEQAMGISEAAGQALFLGDRASVLFPRIKELAELSDAPQWFSTEAVDWARRVQNAIQTRDKLLHRPPVILWRGGSENEEPVVGWNRSRRPHRAEPINNEQLVALVERLAELEKEAIGKLFWGGWQSSFR